MTTQRQDSWGDGPPTTSVRSRTNPPPMPNRPAGGAFAPPAIAASVPDVPSTGAFAPHQAPPPARFAHMHPRQESFSGLSRRSAEDVPPVANVEPLPQIAGQNPMARYMAQLGAPVGDPTCTHYTSRSVHPAYVLIARLVSEHSRRRVRSSLGMVARLLTEEQDDWASYPWHQLRYQHVIGLRSALLERYAPSTVDQMLSAVRQVLKECWRLGYIDADTYQRTVDVGHVRYSRLPAGRALADGEIAALFLSCAEDTTLAGVRDAALLATLYGAGLRRGELIDMDLADLDLAAGTVRVRHGKGDKERLNPLPPGAMTALEAWLQMRGTEPGPLFYCIHRCGYILPRRLAHVSVGDILKRRAEAAQTSALSAHDLRRSFITNLLASGVDLSTTQKLAGHADPKTTTLYDRRGADTMAKAVQALAIPYRPGQPVPARMGQVHR